jgi:PAS domain S-box-containing protein
MRGKKIYLSLLVLTALALLDAFMMTYYLGALRPRYYLPLALVPLVVALIQLTHVSRVKSLEVRQKESSIWQKLLLQFYPFIAALYSVGILGYIFWDANILPDFWDINWPILAAVLPMTWVGQQLAEDKLVSEEKNSALSYLSGQIEDLNLRESTLLEKIVNGILVIDASGTILLINDAARKLLAIEEEDALKQPFDRVLHPSEQGVKYHDAYDPVSGFKQRVLETKKPLVITEMNFIDKNGETKTFNFSANPIYNKENELTRMIIVLQDVTLNYQLEKMRMDFVSIASHELRTPLTSINGYLSLLMNGDAGEAETRLYIERINASVGRLGKLVKSILNVSRIEQNRMKVDKKPCNLYRIANDELANFIPLAEEKKITLYALSGYYSHYRVFADEDMLREVIMNYISNAIKYTNEGGEVRLIIKDDVPGALRFEVKDNGIGIEPKHQKNLFSQFYRVDSELVQQQQGTGLGLYIAKRYMESMGGQVGIESQLAVGSSFYFVLNRAEDATDITLDEAAVRQQKNKPEAKPAAAKPAAKPAAETPMSEGEALLSQVQALSDMGKALEEAVGAEAGQKPAEQPPAPAK